MMAYLRDEDFEELPENDGDAFTRLEAISRERLHNAETDTNGNLTYESIMGYMNEIAALASEFNIPDISYEQEPDNYHTEFGRFTRAVEYRLAQIRVQRARRLRRNSVALTGTRRERIQHFLERIRDEIQGADIPDKRKRALLDRLADFERELAKNRFDLMKAMALFALAAAAAHDFVGTLNETKELVQSISAVLGSAQIEDEEAAKLLPQHEPFKAIPDLRQDAKAANPAFDADLDDDVPF
jgi:hypothetical protein